MLRALSGLHTIRLFLASAMLLTVSPLGGLADDDYTSVDNVRFEVLGELVYIHYDLRGANDVVHSVRLFLMRESDTLFRYRPINVMGDVGTIVFPGDKRRITWDFTKEFPEGLTGTDYYFVVEAEPLEDESINPLVWVGGGAAVVGGLLIFLLSGSDETIPPPGPTFPAPPGRP